MSRADASASTKRQTRGSQRPTAKNGKSLISQRTQVIIAPTPDEVYLAYWKKSKAWSAVLVCDTSKPGLLQELGLKDCVPKCYVYNRQAKTLSWRKAYRDEGRLTSEREFPVIYFDGLAFPEKSATGWVAAKDLQKFNNASTRKLIENYGQVRRFLKEREELRRKNEVWEISSSNSGRASPVGCE